MKHGNHGSCILSNVLEASHKYAFLLHHVLILHINMKSRKFYILKYSWISFPCYIIDEILNFVNDKVQIEINNKYRLII